MFMDLQFLSKVSYSPTHNIPLLMCIILIQKVPQSGVIGTLGPNVTIQGPAESVTLRGEEIVSDQILLSVQTQKRFKKKSVLM